MFQNLSLLEVLLKGGPVFLVLLGVSVLAIAVILERWLAIGAAQRNGGRFRKQVLARVHSGKWEEAVVLCRENPGQASDVYLAALERRHYDKEVIEEAVEREGERLTMALEKRLHILATIGGTTPFVGLFGTVLGIINAFNSISSSASYAPALVSNGIAEALVNTAAGLFVAIPSVLAYNYFSQRIQRFIGELQLACSEIVEAICEDPLR